jgi:Surface-adhesin protein E
MVILRGGNFFRVFLVISCSLVFLITAPSSLICGNKWVLIGKNVNNFIYYDPSSVKIDNKNETFKVLTKWVFTAKGQKGFSKNIDDKENNKLVDISHSLILYQFHYTKRGFNITKITEYSKSGKILYNNDTTQEWRDIPAKSIIDSLFNKIIEDYKL